MAKAKRDGVAYVEVHADTDPFAREAEAGVKQGAERAEKDLKGVGDEWGETLSDGMSDRLEKEGPNFAKSVEKGLNRQKVKVPIHPEFDRDRASVRRAVTGLFSEIEDAVEQAAAGGGGVGGFGKIGQAFSDAIGAGFNVSGKSPLIGFLIPVIGAIIGVVLAAIQAVNALLAVLVTLPGILAAIGFQVGVLMVAFQGVGTAIQGAFAAKNAKELQEAIKGLAPSAQAFVKSLLPLKDFFYQLRYTTQQNFFKAFGDDLIPQLLKFQGDRILRGFQELAKALGATFREIGFFFNSNAFAQFLDEIFPRTITFLEQFGPAFVTFLEGLINLANAAMPFMTEVGGIVAMLFTQLGNFFTDTANDPEFLVWLTEMRDTLDEVVTFVKVAFVFIGQLLDSVNKAGGENAITALSTAIALIGDFLASDVGISSMKFFINTGIFFIAVMAGLIIAIIAITGMFQRLVEFIALDVIPAIGGFFGWLGDRLSELWHKVTDVFADFVNKAKGFATAGREAIEGFAAAVRQKISDAFAAVGNFMSNAKNRVVNFFSDAVGWLWQAGKNIVTGLIAGVMSMLNPLGNAMAAVGQKVRDNVPHSPAKEGPLSGKGDTLYAGQKIVQRLAAGMEMETPMLRDTTANVASNITFGPNSIQMRFSGLPNDDQSRSAGNSVANGIFSTLARDTRIAVRTL